MTFLAYPSYKESGIEWLGMIPSNWVVAGLKHKFKIVGGSTPKSDASNYWDGEIPWITPADLSKLQSRFITQTIRSITEAGLASCGTTLVPPHSVVLSTRAPIGSLAVTAVQACTNQGCKALVPLERADSTFAFYALSVATEQLNVRGKGTTFLELSSDELGAFSLAFPPLPEQRSITAFLDRETAKIDALVEEQRRLIALLKQKRQAVISHAVTKGLNPDAPMKDSGIEWLGDVPAHWERVQLGRLCRQVSDGPHFSPSYVDSGVMFLSARNIRVDGWSLDDAKYISEEDYIEFCRRVTPELSDVLYTKGGTTGVARVVDIQDRFQVWVHIAVLKLYTQLSNPYFVAYALNSSGCYEQSQLHTRGATNQDLGLTRLKKIWLALAPIAEQTKIVEYLNTKTVDIDALVGQANAVIDLLHERRAALISAAVTGKIDVRSPAEVLAFPASRAKARGLVAAEIIERSTHQTGFGRVILQKVGFLAEAHVDVSELEGNFLREAAGPLDREMIREMECEAGVLAGIQAEQPDGAGTLVTYRLEERRGAHREELATLLGDRAAKLDKLIRDMVTLDKKGAEAVATLYAVWNDALIDGETPSDDRIVSGFLTEWHPEKREKFRPHELHTWLGWMRRHDLVPNGTGPRTSTGRLFI